MCGAECELVRARDDFRPKLHGIYMLCGWKRRFWKNGGGEKSVCWPKPHGHMASDGQQARCPMTLAGPNSMASPMGLGHWSHAKAIGQPWRAMARHVLLRHAETTSPRWSQDVAKMASRTFRRLNFRLQTKQLLPSIHNDIFGKSFSETLFWANSLG